jgi:hypothetical protein
MRDLPQDNPADHNALGRDLLTATSTVNHLLNGLWLLHYLLVSSHAPCAESTLHAACELSTTL